MKLIDWADKQPGDIGFVRNRGLTSDLIALAERMMHPGPRSFVPSHVFVVGYLGKVIEAELNESEDSVAAVNDASKYDHLPTRLYRIQRTAEQTSMAVDSYVKRYGPGGYGWMNLIGFALDAVAHRLGDADACNLIRHSYVCSQSGLLFLREPAAETWPWSMKIRDCDPLGLLLACEANAG